MKAARPGRTLALLLGCVAIAYLPHLAHLPLWVGVALASCAAGLIAITGGRMAAPGRWLRLGLALTGLAAVAAQYGRINGADSGSALLALMLGLKLLEIRTGRDRILVVYLCFFLLGSGFLHDQALPGGALALLGLLPLTAAWILLQAGADGPSPAMALRTAAVLLAQALPLMLILFLLFPRLSGPLWSIPRDTGTTRFGLSDHMAPGAIAALGQSGAVAFRVRFFGPTPPPASRYWRALVLWDYDGQTWRTRQPAETNPTPLTPLGAPLSYEITLEPQGQPWLPLLDVPARLERTQARLTGREAIEGKPVEERLRYEASSYLNYRLAAELDPGLRGRALALPEKGNPAARALAEQWQARLANPAERSRAALTLFRQAPFYYTLDPPPLGPNGIDDFLFNTQRGFCEHYAGAFVFLMRAAGVPARVVTGYQGGETNPLGDYLIVRQADAHAWAEIWLADRGWVRIDPTAAVAPERIEDGAAAALAGELSAPVRLLRESQTLQRLRLSWDAVNYRWNDWVLGYGPEKQRTTLTQLGFESVEPGRLMGWMTLITVGVGAMVGLWMGRRRDYRREDDPVAAGFGRLTRRLSRAGYPVRPGEGPRDYLARCAAAEPAWHIPLGELCEQYLALRYSLEPAPQALPRFKRTLRRFHPRWLRLRGRMPLLHPHAPSVDALATNALVIPGDAARTTPRAASD